MGQGPRPAVGFRQGLRPSGALRRARPSGEDRTSGARRDLAHGQRQAAPARRPRRHDLVGARADRLSLRVLHARAGRSHLLGHARGRRTGQARRRSARRNRWRRRAEGQDPARFVKLYTYFRSSAAFRVRIALNLKGLAYEPVFVHLAKGEHRKPEYAKVNPQALVPTLELEDGTRLNQSLAIIEYLDETHPQNPLVPKDPLGRARVRSLSYLVASEIHPLNNLRVLQHLKRALGQSEEAVNAWYRHWIGDGLAKLEAELASGAGAGKFSHGHMPSMADCCLVPQIFNAKRYN